MSFGPSGLMKQQSDNLQGVTNTANINSANANMAGQGLLNLGQGNTSAGTNFFNTLMSGNQGATTAALQPDINRIREGAQGTLQGVSTLTPRGGGRSGTLFQLPFQQNQQVQSLYNTIRPQAAQALTSAGIAQSGQGANLFGVGNQALSTAAGASGTNLDYALKQQQQANQMAQQFGSGIFSLLSLPVGGGGTVFGNLFK